MRRVIPPLLVILLLGAVGFGVAQFYEGRKLRATLAGLSQQRDELRKQVAELQKLNAALSARSERAAGTTRAAPEGPAENRGSAALPVAETATTMNRPERLDGGRFNTVMNSPEVQQLMAIQQKAGLDGRYAALFRRLNLSPDELEKFKNLLVEKQAVLSDVIVAARSQGLNPREGRDEIRALVQSTQAEIDEGIRAALGETAYTQYKDYEATLPQRGLVDQLGQRLSYSGSPLSDGQADQLVRILAAASPGSGGNRSQPAAAAAGMVQRVAVAGVPGRGVPITDEAVTQARAVLLPEQVAALQGLQQEQQAAAQLMEQMRTRRQNQQGGVQLPSDPGGG